MSPYQTVQFLKYRWEARGLHGTHSPFVYAFVENVLRSKNKNGALGNMLRYFQFNNITSYGVPSHVSTEGIPVTSDVLRIFDHLYISAIDAAFDQPFTDKLLAAMTPKDVLAFTSLHQSGRHTAAWAQIKNYSNVKLTIDLFDLGLVFFRDEFMEKQHFILR